MFETLLIFVVGTSMFLGYLVGYKTGRQITKHELHQIILATEGELCKCGHREGDHFEDRSGCAACNCGGFQAAPTS